MVMQDRKTIASMIDHTVLKAAATKEQVLKCCQEAKEYGFASVCTNPCYTALVAEELRGSNVKVCTVIGFPLGANTPEVKEFEAKEAVKAGAEEVDMVINIGALKQGNYEVIEKEIAGVVKAAGTAGLKVIIETCYLTDTEKENACIIAKRAGANFVKTSTGFGSGGATVEDVRLMRKTVGPKMGVKRHLAE